MIDYLKKQKATQYSKVNNTINDQFIWFLINVLLIIPLIVPEGLSVISQPIYTLLYYYGRILVQIGIVFIYTFFVFKQRRIEPIAISCFAFVALSLLCTFYNHGNVSKWQLDFSMCAYTVMLIELNKERLSQLISISLFILQLMLLINFICLLLYPNGMYLSKETGYYQNWFLGYKSSLQYYILPAVCFGWIKCEYGGTITGFLLLLFISTVEAFLSGNAMLTVGMFIFIVFYFLKLSHVSKFINITTYSVIVICLNILLLLFLPLLTQSRLGIMILTFLGKGTSLTWRGSVIWPNTIEAISHKMFLGNGVQDINTRRAMYSNLKGAIHAHNQLLEVLFVGGVFLLLAYLIIHFIVFKKIKKYSNLDISKILSLCIFILYIMMTVEVFFRPISFPVWLLLLIGYYSEELDYEFNTKAELFHIGSKRIRVKHIKHKFTIG